LTELDNLDLQGAPQPPEYHEGRGLVLWIAAALLIAGGGAAYWYFFWRQQPAVEPVQAGRRPAAEAPLEPVPAPQIPLPTLEASDALVRELVRQLSSHPALMSWLVSKDLIRTFVVAVELVANGSNPTQQAKFLAPGQKFRTTGGGAVVHIDPRSYQRFDRMAEVVASLDAAGCARVYQTLEPLIEEAYRELDHPEGGFRAALGRAFRQILLTPVIEEPIALVPQVRSYEFAAPELEQLAPVQKQLIGMGPRNLRLVQDKVREIAAALQIIP